MPTTPLQGKLSFQKFFDSDGDAGLRLHLQLKALGSILARVLSSGGSLNLQFVDRTDDTTVGELMYDYSAPSAKTELNLTPNEANHQFPLCGHTQTVQNPAPINDKAVEISWELYNWRRPGTFYIKGSVVASKLTGGGAVQAEFQSDPFTMVAAEPVPGTGGGVPAGPTTPIPPQTPPPTSEPEPAPAHISPLPLPITLFHAQRAQSSDQYLWGLLRRRTISFSRYRSFIDRVLCNADQSESSVKARDYVRSHQLPFTRAASYAMLKHATEYYLMQEAGVVPLYQNPPADGGVPARWDAADEQSRTAGPVFDINIFRDSYLEKLEKDEGRVLPYFKIIRDKLSEVEVKRPEDLVIGDDELSYGILKSKLEGPPLMELIWSYWHEEGGLVQTMNALSLRFQNVRRPGPGPDPLANLAIDPLRPLNNIIWGYIEDERNRLTMNRRNLEYQYEYGFGLIGRGVQPIAVAENRTFFLRSFHSLLRAATEFYQQANFTTVIPDGFPILNHLREVHLTLAEGAHNQYGDLPWTARVEMLTQQWILARPEVREFLGGRIMVPYSEPWMDRVDNMKSLQGWNPTNITHFRDLGAFGEQLLLSIRYGSWNSPAVGATNAANWAHYWREEIQRYIHAYKAVTGIDLATDLGDIRQNTPDNEERYLQPAQLIERQNALQQGQLRRTRHLNGPLAPPRPLVTPTPRRRALNE